MNNIFAQIKGRSIPAVGCFVLLLVLIFGVVLAPGCQQETESPPTLHADMTKGFFCAADITFGEMKMTADIRRRGPGLCQITFTSPQLLNGMDFSFSGEDVTLSYHGLSYQFGEDALPAQSVASSISSAMDLLANTSALNITALSGDLLLTGETQLGEFYLTVNDESGAVIALEVPRIHLKAEFSEFTFLE